MATSIQQQKKAASSKKILTAACEEFSVKGYSGTKIADVAARADVASGLVSQRFGSKDGLYKAALKELCDVFVRYLDKSSITSVLGKILKEIKHGAEGQSSVFRFLTAHFTDANVPKDCDDILREVFESSNLKTLFEEEIKNGRILNGDPFAIFKMFVKSSLMITDSYAAAGLPFPDDSEYLRLLHTENAKQVTENTTIISTLVNDYDLICYVDAFANEVSFYRISDEFREIMGTFDNSLPSNRKFDAFLRMLVHPDDFSQFLSDVNREKLIEQLDHVPAAHVEFRALYHGEVQHFILKLAKDKNSEHGYIIGISNRENEHTALAHEERKNEVMRLLAQEYTAIYYVDLVSAKFELFSISDRIIGDTGKMIAGARSTQEAFAKFVEASVHPLDRARMMETLVTVRERLAHAKSFSEVFRRNYDGEYLFTEMTVVKIDDVDKPVTAVALGFAEKDAQLKLSAKQEEAMREGISILYSTEDVKTALNNLMKILVDFHEADCAYIFELNHDRTLIRMSYEAVCDGLTPIVGDDTIEPAENRKFWFDAFRKNGELIIMDVDTELPHDSDLYRKCKEDDVENFMCVPLTSEGEITGFIGVDNAGFANGDLMILRTVSALVSSELLRRQQTDEEHIILNKIASNLTSVYYADLDSNYIHNYTITDEYRERYQNVRSYDEYIRIVAANDLSENDRDRFCTMASPEYIRREFRSKDSFNIAFLDASPAAPKNFEMQFIKASDDGSRFVMCVKDNTDAVEHEKQLRRTQAEQMERLISERTAELQEKNKQLSRINEDVIELLGNITEARDSDSGEHIRRVKGFTNILANQVKVDLPEYGLSDRIIGLMTSASALHDVGKIMIPDAVLLKPGRLTKEEFEVMKSHCVRGCEILQDAPSDWSAEYMKMSMDICRYHHEKYDGSGYPDGLAGDDIPISAQIVSIADCFDALTTKRVYKDAYTCEKAFDMILMGECGVFSPKLLQCFRKCREAFFDHAVNASSPYSDMVTSPADKLSLFGTKILLAEDNDISRDICIELLESEGATVTAVRDGRAAVELFKRSDPSAFDAILMDLVMPGMSGVDATVAIRCMDTPHARSIPIIALTAADDPPELESCMRAGMSSFLTKPFSVSAVTRVLLECLRDQSDALLEQLSMAVKMSNRDPLTGVKDMTAYTDMVGTLTEEIQKTGGNIRFGLVECDINGLKGVNDQLGHDVGDTYIKNCSALICSIFKHSPVFRIGGDEFVTVLRGEDYEARAALLEELKLKVAQAENISSVFDGKASMAYGLAVFDSELDEGVSTVFRRADGSMYNKKRLMRFSGSRI